MAKRKYTKLERLKAELLLDRAERLFPDGYQAGWKISVQEASARDQYMLDEIFSGICDLKDFIAILCLIQENAEAAGYFKVAVQLSGDRDGDTTALVYGTRPETAAEARERRADARARKERAAQAAKTKAAKQAQAERELYERLKQKYEQ